PAAVERRAGALVLDDPAGRAEARAGDDARRDRPDGVVREVGEERLQPPRRWRAVSVDEGDDVRRRRLGARVARRRRSPRLVMAHDAGAAALSGQRGARPVAPVVHHDDGRRTAGKGKGGRLTDASGQGVDGGGGAEGLERRRQPGWAVAYRHDDDHRRPERRWTGVGEAGVEQLARQPLAGRRLPDGRTVGQRVERTRPRCSEPQDPHRRAPDDDPATIGPPRAGVEDEPERRRERSRHDAVMPASTGSTAPVIAALSGPQSHSINAATSSGCTRRPSWWWAAKSSLVANPYTPALASSIIVAVEPGATALTVIPSGPCSAAE